MSNHSCMLGIHSISSWDIIFLLQDWSLLANYHLEFLYQYSQMISIYNFSFSTYTVFIRFICHCFITIVVISLHILCSETTYIDLGLSGYSPVSIHFLHFCTPSKLHTNCPLFPTLSVLFPLYSTKFLPISKDVSISLKQLRADFHIALEETVSPPYRAKSKHAYCQV